MKRDHLYECGGCGAGEKTLLYHIRHRGVYRRLCTGCILKFHPGSFCPICFEVYEESPAPSESVLCVKCPSVTHSSCLDIDISPRYECPPCANPNFVFFQGFEPSKKHKSVDTSSPRYEFVREIDNSSAKILVAAARIASASMAKAANMARVESERRIRESVLAKKRAKEALERVSYLLSRDKEKEKDQIHGSSGKLHTSSSREMASCKMDTSTPMMNQDRFVTEKNREMFMGLHKVDALFQGNGSSEHAVQDDNN